MGVVHEAVEDGVGDGWIGDHLVPMLHIDLAGYDRAAASVPIVEDLQEVAALIGRRVGEPPVVKDQELDAREGLKQARVPTVTACKRERIEQPRQAVIEDGAIVAAGLVAECTGQPTFAEPGLADDDQVLMPRDPVAGSELGEERLVEPARRPSCRYPR